MSLAYVGIGSNLGDRSAHLDASLQGLARVGIIAGGSSIYETAPVGGVDQDAFLNAVVAVETDLAPRDLLDALLTIELSRGRRRDVRWGPRTLDLDLLWYDGVGLELPDLTLPHPEIRNRRFVLVPLVQVEPRLGDANGYYADSLDRVRDQAIRRVTGPLHVGGLRWLVGVEDAIELSRSGDEWAFASHPDWANSSGDMFGAYLSAVSLLALRDVAPRMSPVSFAHRFLAGVPAGSSGGVSIHIDRETDRSIDAVFTHLVDGQVSGRSAVSAVASVPGTVSEPARPRTRGVEFTAPIDELISRLDRSMGSSATNWGPLENWDVPDLCDGTESVLRIWSPNHGIGWHDPYLSAASMLMPIDATVWPETMRDMGLLPSGPAISTPTIEFSATFAHLDADDLYHLAEARIGHRTSKSVLASVHLWGDDGSYRATGSSYNLIRDPRDG